MKIKNDEIITQNKVFVWIVIGTLFLLLAPFSLMVFRIPLFDPGSGYEVINWGPEDFIVMGIMLFSFSSIFVLIAGKVKKNYRLISALLILFLFFWLWAEFAVGIFTNWGS